MNDAPPLSLAIHGAAGRLGAAVLELALHHLQGCGTDVFGPIEEALRRPVLVGLVRFGHMLGQSDEAALPVTGMQGNTLALVHNLQGGIR